MYVQLNVPLILEMTDYIVLNPPLTEGKKTFQKLYKFLKFNININYRGVGYPIWDEDKCNREN